MVIKHGDALRAAHWYDMAARLIVVLLLAKSFHGESSHFPSGALCFRYLNGLGLQPSSVGLRNGFPLIGNVILGRNRCVATF